MTMLFQIVLILALTGGIKGGPAPTSSLGLVYELIGKVYKLEKENVQIKETLQKCGIQSDTCEAKPKHFGSCQDVYNHTKPTKSDVFTIYPDGKAVKVYCDFHDGFGYTYISKHSLNQFTHIDKLYTDNSHAMIRHIRSDGTQREVKVEQLSQYKSSYNLGFLLNNHDGYNWMHNQALAPYLYLGFLPKSFAASKTIQGYRVAGKDQTFRNCDANPNSYIAFLANPSGLAPNGYYKRCCNNSFMRKWIELANSVPDDRKMPDEFYYFFEMHMGGCGGYIVANSIPGVNGAAIGFRFDAAK